VVKNVQWAVSPTKKSTGPSTRLSRSKLDLFVRCPLCFWLDARHHVKRPEGYPYTLSIAVDHLLKDEFDSFRRKGEPHPLMKEAGIDALPWPDEKRLEVWRDPFRGLEFKHPIGITLFGAVDDIFQFPDGTLAIVDYKSTGAKVVSVYDDYRRQLNIYTYLLEKNGEQIAGKGYFVFYQVDKTRGFEGRLPFKGSIVEVPTDVDSVEPLIANAVRALRSEGAPRPAPDCDYCGWRVKAAAYGDPGQGELFQ